MIETIKGTSCNNCWYTEVEDVGEGSRCPICDEGELEKATFYFDTETNEFFGSGIQRNLSKFN